MRQSGSEFVVTITKFFLALGPNGRWWYSEIEAILIYALIILTIYSFLADVKFNNKIVKWVSWALNRNQVFAILFFAFVMLCRVPTAMFGYLNPDESLWVACAKTLAQEPWLWLACDTSTSGPLVVLPLVVIKALHLPIDFGTARLAAGATIGVVLVFMFLAANNFFGKAISRVIMLPLIISVGFGMSLFWDFVTYNGEHMALLMLGIAIYLYSEIWHADRYSIKKLILLGLALGFTPYAKLQCVPMALVVTIFSFIYLFRHAKFTHLIFFVLSGILPSVIVISWTFLTGGISHFWNSYILYNLVYATSETPKGISFFSKISFAWSMLFQTPLTSFYFQMCTIVCFFCLILVYYKAIAKNWVDLRILIFSSLLFIVSLYCVGQPYRLFQHYTFFAFFSFLFLLGACLQVFLRSHGLFDNNQFTYGGKIALAILTFAALLYFSQIFSYAPAYYGYVNMRTETYAHLPKVVQAINQHSAPGDRLAVWGWSGSFYSDTDLIMGTRYADTSGIILHNTYSQYFLKTFLEDLDKNKPTIFLDAIAPMEPRFYDRSTSGFERHSELQSYITSHYTLTEEIDGYRIYVRRQ